MAIQIPTQSRVSENVGNVRLSGVQADNSAFKNAMNTVGSIAGQELQKLTTKLNIAAVQEASNSMAEWSNNALNGENGLYTQKGKNAFGAVDKLKESFTQWRTEQQALMTNDVQRENFEKMADQELNRLNQIGTRYQFNEIQQYEANQQRAYVATQEVQAASNYQDIDSVNKSIDNIADSIRATGNLNGESDEVIALRVLESQNKVRTDVASQLINDKNYQGAKAFITKYESQFLPTQRSQLMKTITSAEQAAAAKIRAQKTQDINEYVTYLSTGGAERRDYSLEQLQGLYGAEKGAKVFAEIKDQEAFATELDNIKYNTVEQDRALIESTKPTEIEGIRRESAQHNAIVRAVQQKTQAIANDPAQYLISNQYIATEWNDAVKTGNYSDYYQATKGEQDRMGIPAALQTVIPKKSAQLMIEQYNKGGENGAQFIQTLKDQWGDAFPAVMRDLNRYGLHDTAQVISIMPAGNAANMLAEADKQGLKTLKEMVEPAVTKEISEDVFSQLEEFRSSVAMTPNGAGTFNKVKDSVELLAHKYVSQGMKPSKAIEQAAGEVINDRYEFFDNYRVPTTVNNQPVNTSTVREGVDNYSVGIKDIPLMIPAHGDMPRDVAEKIYRRNLVVTPVTMNDDSGMVFVDQNGNTILTASGQPVIATWEQLEAMGK